MNNRSINGYNLLAPFYDDLAALIFGKSLFDAQIFFFKEIPPQSYILVLGGGSGWFLPELFKRRPDIRVCYIDASEKMIRLAQHRKILPHQIHFIRGTEALIPQGEKFDVVILNFYVDGFNEDELPRILNTISESMKPGALWFLTDFMDTGKRSHRLLMWITHLFFKILIHHPNRKLVTWWKVFEQAGFKVIKERTWSRGLIRSIIYSRD
jgi:SAM-dependent methyltransferase